MADVKVIVLSGHCFVFGMKRDRSDRAPLATLRLGTWLPEKSAELTPSDVEAMLSVLLRIREKQRDFTPADESKASAPAQATPPVEQRKSTAKSKERTSAPTSKPARR